MDPCREDDEPLLRELFSLLTEWKNLTLAEHQKIEASDWKALEHLQSRKAQLRHSIEKLELAFSENRLIPGERKAAGKKRLRQFAAELVLLEKKNHAILSDRIAEVDRQLKSSNKTIQSLRHVQKAYGSGKSSFWQAYS